LKEATILFRNGEEENRARKRRGKKGGRTYASVGRAKCHLWRFAKGVSETHLFCPAVIETQAVHNSHLPIQHLLFPPKLLLHLSGLLDCLGNSIVVI